MAELFTSKPESESTNCFCTVGLIDKYIIQNMDKIINSMKCQPPANPNQVASKPLVSQTSIQSNCSVTGSVENRRNSSSIVLDSTSRKNTEAMLLYVFD